MAMIRVLENEFYYLDNFQRVLDWIAGRYADLLDSDEQDFIARFPALPQPARALFVRMVMRKGQLFRASKLDYAEIGCPVEAARALLPTGWIAVDPVLTLDEVFDLLSKPEIAQAFQLPSQQRQARKSEQLEALRERCGEERAFSNWYRGCGDTVFAILLKPLCDRLRLLFFGNLSQDWTEFVLSDLGLFRYEQVEFSPASRGFRSRADIEHYLQLHACKERYYAEEPALEVLQALRALPPHAFANDWLDSRRERLLFQLGQQLEKDKDWEQAHGVYAECRYPGARSRAIRVLEKHEKFDQAYALFETASAAPESEAERQHLLRIGPRLARKLGHPKGAAQRKAPVVRLDLSLARPGGEWRVEGVVLEHLHSEQAPVFYVENTLANTLFGLLCWPAIFAAIPGAFFHPFHRGPADLYSGLPPAPPEGIRCLPGAPGRRQLPRRHARHLGTEGRPAIALRILGLPGLEPRRTGPGLHSGRPPEAVVPAHPAGRARQPHRLPRPDPVPAGRIRPAPPLQHDRSEGPRRPPAGQPAALDRVLRRA